MNAAFGLLAADRVKTAREGFGLAREVVSQGKAAEVPLQCLAPGDVVTIAGVTVRAVPAFLAEVGFAVVRVGLGSVPV